MDLLSANFWREAQPPSAHNAAKLTLRLNQCYFQSKIKRRLCEPRVSKTRGSNRSSATAEIFTSEQTIAIWNPVSPAPSFQHNVNRVLLKNDHISCPAPIEHVYHIFRQFPLQHQLIPKSWLNNVLGFIYRTQNHSTTTCEISNLKSGASTQILSSRGS